MLVSKTSIYYFTIVFVCNSEVILFNSLNRGYFKYSLISYFELICLQGKEEFLKVFAEQVEVHATVFVDPNNRDQGQLLPEFVINHGIMSGPDLHALLLESQVSN